ncbi:Hypothetical predicted protein [Lecanosticta acicola]|uniref:Uncharacterized protein n=1 Tax=Lecanosticta acicola TaxID=111012 RepID=A0AAI8Z0L7_9PEZI|nr:Hypothetical predicted protein [Lecanosticta acicola]
MASAQEHQGQAGFARPDRFTIGFAIAIVRSKPPEISVGEYIRLLKLHIAKGRRQDAVSTVHRHLDRSAFWRSEYERMKDSFKSVEDEATDLRREIVVLKSELNAAKPASSTKKRKKGVEEDTPLPRPAKKGRIIALPVKTILMPFDHPSEIELSESGQIGNVLMRHIFRIQTASKQHQHSDASELAYHLQQAVATISELVQREIRACMDDADSDRLRKTLVVITRSIVSVFVGFKKLSSEDDGLTMQGKVVYAVVMMFKNLLSGIDTISTAEIEKTVGTASSGTAPTSKNSKGNGKAVSTQQSPMLSTLTSFIGDVVHLLDAKVEANRALFEGFTYCTLELLGARLFSSTFGHIRASTIEAEIRQGDAQDESTQQQIRVEAPYLIHLLHRVMLAAPSHLGSAITKGGKPRSMIKHKNSPKDALAVAAGQCLQRTLVNSIFGTEGIDEEDPFMDCLKMPSAAGGPVSMPKGKDTDFQEWYKEEVWRLLGWEILAREDGLPKKAEDA